MPVAVRSKLTRIGRLAATKEDMNPARIQSICNRYVLFHHNLLCHSVVMSLSVSFTVKISQLLFTVILSCMVWQRALLCVRTTPA